MGGKRRYALPVIAEEDYVLSFYITAKDVLPTLLY